MQKIVSYAGQSVNQSSTEHSQERRLKDAHKQENRQPEAQQHNSVSDRFRRVLPLRNGSSFEQPSLDSPVQSIFLESESWLLFNPCFFHEIFRKDSSCFFFIEVIANEVFGDVLSFCHLQPDAASGMALQEGSQIVQFVLYNPEPIRVSPQFAVPYCLFFTPQSRGSLDPASRERPLGDWYLKIFSHRDQYLFTIDQKCIIETMAKMRRRGGYDIIKPQIFLEYFYLVFQSFVLFLIVQLVFKMQGKEVVLVEGKLTKIIHQEGEGEVPVKGQEVFALYKGTLQDGTLFDSNQDRQNPFNFVLGQGRVIKGWDEGFASMKKGEKATLVCSPEYAYGVKGSPPKIPANATLNFDVELLDFKDKKKEKWEFSDEEKMAEANKFKASGNDHFKKGDFKAATSDYKEAIDFVQNEHSPETKQLLNVLRLNIAQAYLKLNKSSEAVDHCTKVLKEEPENLKALYRRGVAYSKMQEFDQAKTDIKHLLKLDPNNADAKKELVSISAAIKQYEQKEKKVFGSIFSKGGLYDDVKTTSAKPEVKKVESDSEEEEIKAPEGEKPEPMEAEQPAEKPAAETKTE